MARKGNSRLLKNATHLAQISLAILAFFGYFYTVQPIYQKDRLAEQVAQYELTIAQQQQLLEENRNQLPRLLDTREKLSTEISNLKVDLEIAKQEKEEFEKQIQVMTYRYRLPDGTPAITKDQIQKSKEYNFISSYLGDLRNFRYGKTEVKNVFYSRNFFSAKRIDGKDNIYFPFVSEEIDAWKQFGNKYPSILAFRIIEKFESSYPYLHGLTSARANELVREYNGKLVKLVKASSIWSEPFNPEDLAKEYLEQRKIIDDELKKELAKIDEEYKNHPFTFSNSTKVIYEHNYKVNKINARTKYFGPFSKLKMEYRDKANSFRSGIENAVRDLLKQGNMLLEQ